MTQHQSESVVYVSWGGTGRGAALRHAYEAAADEACELLYLAVLDPPHFADLDHTFIDLVAEELRWLLDAHLRTVAAASHRDVPYRILVRIGEVDDEVLEVVQAGHVRQIVIGAPMLLEANDRSVDQLKASLEQRSQVPVVITTERGLPDSVDIERL